MHACLILFPWHLNLRWGLIRKTLRVIWTINLSKRRMLHSRPFFSLLPSIIHQEAFHGITHTVFSYVATHLGHFYHLSCLAILFIVASCWWFWWMFLVNWFVLKALSLIQMIMLLTIFDVTVGVGCWQYLWSFIMLKAGIKARQCGPCDSLNRWGSLMYSLHTTPSWPNFKMQKYKISKIVSLRLP